MNLKNLHSVYFLGIGGIGMSAIARWFAHQGIAVSGYDRTSSALTQQLEQEGIKVHFEDSQATLPSGLDKENSLVVWTPAIPANSYQLNYFRQNGFQLKKRSEVLGMITEGFKTVAVAGTHGKTSTSALVAHLLKVGGLNVTAFLGGITQNFNSNLLLSEGDSDAQVIVVEADEFDRSFLTLHPNIAIVTSLDPDHLDIYGDANELEKSFADFINLIDKKGKLFIQKNAVERLNRNNFGSLDLEIYGLNGASIQALDIQSGIRSFEFTYSGKNQSLENLALHVPGFHNVENALAAISVALELGIDADSIRKGLESYKGVKRRFEIRYQQNGRVYIDDYAHHPEEIKAFLGSVKAMYPDNKLTAIFQPHLFSRTKDFAKEFSESLSLAEEVLLLDIYPARELPIEGVTSRMLLPGITSGSKAVLAREDVIPFLEKNKPEVLVTIGAGDIDRMVEPITKWMEGNDE
ncbi:UDP-N-acetylmuramate--L-alanine ligase [Litoribacter ruber]|uniref:UDP-N-acetylmuramate--L-alanine ligase n=1 Tax=Litoribacter ruber TaxID=702568 RepID=A0AAP2CH10_9BACT|nr:MULTISPECIES: UDP-N-acetylmuramate--L-alanine ligase [Litoribacter]MBS9523952.1 UDP-N-acetylmuramate--L-alanine ligase [Litoribacter alkaliphilus]MBT0811453.1 UDP-N-acetylmuramate--L-alanine ligase [Litoribacter ruber]